MRFRVIRELDWAGLKYQFGAILNIPESERRIGGLVRGGFIRYDCGLPSPDDFWRIGPIGVNAQ